VISVLKVIFIGFCIYHIKTAVTRANSSQIQEKFMKNILGFYTWPGMIL